MTAPAKKIAVFDFDHTLITGDSLWAFLAFAAGWPRIMLAVAQGLVRYAADRWLVNGLSRNFVNHINKLASCPRRRASISDRYRKRLFCKLWAKVTRVRWMPACAGMTLMASSGSQTFSGDFKVEAGTQKFRDFIKAQLLQILLAGKNLADLAPALDRLSRWQQWNPAMRQALLDHHAEGFHIVIASGALSLYLPYLLKDTPHDAVICTQIGVDQGLITGAMTVGNCIHERKAELVRDYMTAHGPFDESWGYGNFPHDVPMLQLMQYRVIV